MPERELPEPIKLDQTEISSYMLGPDAKVILGRRDDGRLRSGVQGRVLEAQRPKVDARAGTCPVDPRLQRGRTEPTRARGSGPILGHGKVREPTGGNPLKPDIKGSLFVSL
jgi:hypothetical protein